MKRVASDHRSNFVLPAKLLLTLTVSEDCRLLAWIRVAQTAIAAAVQGRVGPRATPAYSLPGALRLKPRRRSSSWKRGSARMASNCASLPMLTMKRSCR